MNTVVARGVNTVVARTAVRGAVAGLVVIGLVLRFRTASDLWLDEALSVNIARLPLPSLLDALRRDGSPPVYYLLLHGWTALFGTGDVAVRALSGVASVGTLPLVWVLGRDLGGPRCSRAALVLFASSPFAIRYATETRMYSLVILLTVAGGLALRRTLGRPTLKARVGLALITGLLLLTHYWAFYLVTAVVAWLAVEVRRSGRRGPAAAALVAMAGGSLLLVPWLPTLVFQIHHTGTPWGVPATFSAIADTVNAFGGGDSTVGWTLTIALLGLAGTGIVKRPRSRPLAAIVLTTLVLAVGVSLLLGSAFAVRYTSVILAAFLLLVALGATAVDRAWIRGAVLTLAAVAGLYGGSFEARQRTQAGQVAEALREGANPGDLVAFCPDQLGPAVSRLAPAGLLGRTFPLGGSPELVDWVDYAARNAAGRPAHFARALLAEAGPGRDVWLVWAPGYRTLGSSCLALNRDLAALRPGERVVARDARHYLERAELWRFPAP